MGVLWDDDELPEPPTRGNVMMMWCPQCRVFFGVGVTHECEAEQPRRFYPDSDLYAE